MHWIRKDYCPKCETETSPIAWLILISHINGGHSALKVLIRAPRLKFPQRGAQADVQRQNPAVRQPGHGFVVAHVIGDDARNPAGSRVEESGSIEPGIQRFGGRRERHSRCQCRRWRRCGR